MLSIELNNVLPYRYLDSQFTGQLELEFSMQVRLSFSVFSSVFVYLLLSACGTIGYFSIEASTFYDDGIVASTATDPDLGPHDDCPNLPGTQTNSHLSSSFDLQMHYFQSFFL